MEGPRRNISVEGGRLTSDSCGIVGGRGAELQEITEYVWQMFQRFGAIAQGPCIIQSLSKRLSFEKMKYCVMINFVVANDMNSACFLCMHSHQHPVYIIFHSLNALN